MSGHFQRAGEAGKGKKNSYRHDSRRQRQDRRGRPALEKGDLFCPDHMDDLGIGCESSPATPENLLWRCYRLYIFLQL